MFKSWEHLQEAHDAEVRMFATYEGFYNRFRKFYEAAGKNKNLTRIGNELSVQDTVKDETFLYKLKHTARGDEFTFTALGIGGCMLPGLHVEDQKIQQVVFTLKPQIASSSIEFYTSHSQRVLPHAVYTFKTHPEQFIKEIEGFRDKGLPYLRKLFTPRKPKTIE